MMRRGTAVEIVGCWLLVVGPGLRPEAELLDWYDI